MKKSIAWLLAVLMAVGMLAGCGAKETPAGDKTATTQATEPQAQPTAPQQAQPQPTQPQQQVQPQPTQPQEVAAGTVLDAPEVTFDTSIEDLYIAFTYPGNGQTESMEIILDQLTADTYALYVSNGMLKLNEIVYEVTDSGITKYYKDTFMETFQQDTALTQAALEAEVAGVMELVLTFMLQHPDLQGAQYRKSDAVSTALTGDAYVYDVLDNGTLAGQVCVDKATGLMVKMTDAAGNNTFTVTQLKTTGVQVPAYK